MKSNFSGDCQRVAPVVWRTALLLTAEQSIRLGIPFEERHVVYLLGRVEVEVIRALQVILIGGQDLRGPFYYLGVELLASENPNVCLSGKFDPNRKLQSMKTLKG